MKDNLPEDHVEMVEIMVSRARLTAITETNNIGKEQSDDILVSHLTENQYQRVLKARMEGRGFVLVEPHVKSR